jgi:signal transduction histidine kinase
VKKPPDRDESATAKAERELDQLHRQADQARKVLARLQRDVAEAARRLGSIESAQLLEANEQLVLALLRAHTSAETLATERRMELPAIESLRWRSTQHASAVAEHKSAVAEHKSVVAGHASAVAEHERGHAQLQEANEQLVLAALSAQELQVAAEQAQQRQTEFLAILAHELRNPLAPIRTAAALLGRVRTDEPLLARVQGVIERQVVHISRLVGDLMDVSRVNTGKLRLERRMIKMAGVIDEAVDACSPAMAARFQRFTLEMPAHALEVHGDPVRLAQVFSNLLDNASKYSLNGGNIRLVVAASEHAMTATVSDDGIGITAEALPHVFDPFVQEIQATVFNGVGLGIGLTVVRELVEAHGGSISASSAGSGLGSEFVVTLPLVEPSPFSSSGATRA